MSVTGPRPRPKRFLDRLHVQNASELCRAERVLATGRAFLAVSSFIAIYLDPTEPSRYAELAYASLAVYSLHSLVVVAFLHLRRDFTPWVSLVLHGVDVVWPAYITLFTEGPNSPFFLYFLFVLLAAAYRWGLRETVVTAGAAVALMVAEASLLSGELQFAGQYVEGQYELNRLIIRGAYLLALGSLVGYLAEQEKLLRAEVSVEARILGHAQVEKGLRGTLQGILGEFVDIFGAGKALLALQDLETGRSYLWDLMRRSEDETGAIRLEEIGPENREMYFFSSEAVALHAILPGDSEVRTEPNWIGINAEGHLLQNIPWPVTDAFRTAHPISHGLMIVSLGFRREWKGHLFLIDPCLGYFRREELLFAQNLLRRAVPAMYNVYIIRRLRTQAGTIERARVARELHDGVIQSVSATLMRLDLLRRQAGTDSASSNELGRIQQILRQEVVNLRELMEQMKPVDIDSRQLVEFLASLVDKFQRETGITARFVSDIDEVPWRPRVCREVVGIVQEGLVNVRRHSSAQNVVVHLGLQNGHWKLVIDDDGHGFPFAGRLPQSDLDLTRRGPVVIKERVRAIGGSLTVDSVPGRGARLEIAIPSGEILQR